MERRAFWRVRCRILTEIEIRTGESSRQGACMGGTAPIRCLVTSIDVSLGGFSVKVLNSPVDTRLSFSPAFAYTLVGKEVTALFRDQGVTVTGRVVRVDPETMLMAVVITRVSDIDRWRRICGLETPDRLPR
ncbi:MAG: PilZ domain-containing protein [Desulfomonilia bacterium]|jgi:hypothetical protein